MFKLQPNPTFIAKVSITVPGKIEPDQLDIEFKHFTRSQLKEFYSTLQGREDADALGELVVGWKGADAPYSADNLTALIDNYPTAATELFEAWRKNLQESRVKN